MTNYTAFKAWHLKELLKEDSAASLRELFTDDVINFIERNNKNVMSIEQDGQIVVSGGITTYWPGRAEAWIFYKHSCRFNFVPVFRLVKNWLNAQDIKRIEASVSTSEKYGRRSVELFGFKLEAPLMKSYLPDGADAALYARVR
jgi:hypothetical protein